ncbi:ACP S-malonyltransferase [bacterium]|nr:ACP S-malonyltransferase [bacterium]
MERIAFLFPGQGSQAVGMAADLYESSPRVREIYERASGVIDVDLATLSFEGPDEELRKTINTQPALLVAGIAAHTLLLERGLEPWAVAGHSLGEYTALVAARSLTLEDGVRAVRERGRLMFEAGLAVPGTMAAIIGLQAEALDAVVAEARAAGIVQAANYNSPTQIVIPGEIDAVRRAMELATERGARRTIELKVSGAFHSELLEDARRGMESFLGGIAIERPQAIFVANATGIAVEEPEEIRRRLVEQIVNPVLWVKSMQTLTDLGAVRMIEVGPGRVLRGLMRKIAPMLPTAGGGTFEDIVTVTSGSAAG